MGEGRWGGTERGKWRQNCKKDILYKKKESIFNKRGKSHGLSAANSTLNKIDEVINTSRS